MVASFFHRYMPFYDGNALSRRCTASDGHRSARFPFTLHHFGTLQNSRLPLCKPHDEQYARSGVSGNAKSDIVLAS